MTQANNLNRLGGQTVVGVFDDVTAAEHAINDLKVTGFTPDSISVITRNRDANNRLLQETEGNEAGQGALSGALGGGTLGAVLGWLLAGGTALIPGVGPIIAAGVLGATVTGALVGGSLGSIASALAGSGIPEEHAQEYEAHIRGGRTLVSANAPTGLLVQNARDVFERNGAVDVRDYGDNTATTNYATPVATQTTTTTTQTYDTPMRVGDQPNLNTTNTAGGTGLNTSQTDPTNNSQYGGSPAGPTGTGPANQTYNQPNPNDISTPGTRYSAPFTDRERQVASSDELRGTETGSNANGNMEQRITSIETDPNNGLPADTANPGGIAPRGEFSERGQDATNFEPVNEKPLGNI